MPSWKMRADNILYIFCILSVIIIIAACSRTADGQEKSIKIISGASEKTVNAEIADSPAGWETGLMYRKSLAPDSGMLFIFPDEDYRSFWMKNTLIPLDMLFISANGTIVDMKESFQPCKADPCESYRSKEKAMYVLEVNAGFARENDIQEGNAISVKQ